MLTNQFIYYEYQIAHSCLPLVDGPVLRWLHHCHGKEASGKVAGAKVTSLFQGHRVGEQQWGGWSSPQ